MFSFLVLSLALLDHGLAGQQRSPFQQSWDAGVPVSVTGTLTVLHADDFENRRSGLIHLLVDERTGKEYRLRFERTPPTGLRSGLRVTAQGRRSESTVYLAADGESGITTASSALATEQAPPVSGDQKTLVIVADFTDRPVNPSIFGGDCSIGAITDRLFTDPLGYSVDAMYRETSRGKVSFSGKVVGPFLIDAASTDACDLNAWSRAAEAKAAAAGVDLTGYSRKLYVLPEANCGANGIGELGVNPSRSWIFSCDRHRVYAHELGHNLGLHHASDSEYEFGDESDVMGGASRLKPFNAPHQVQMGWVPGTQVATVTSDGTHNVAPLTLDPASATAPQALKISVPDSTDSYYVSYRSGNTGFEANLGLPHANSINVHRWAGGMSLTYLLTTLTDGQTWVDPSTGFSITQESRNGAFATVRIRIGADCGRSAPSLTVSAGQTASAGSTLAYDVTLTNNDAAACAASTFALQPALPSGWTGSLSSSALQLVPGAVGQMRLLVTAPITAAAGDYSVGVRAFDTNNSAHSATSTSTFTVPGGDTIPPAAPGGLVAKLKGKDVNLTWNPASDNVGVVRYHVSRNGVAIATTTTARWTDTSAAAGAKYTYWVVASDGAGNQSAASNSVVVQLSSGGRKGK